jgi:hypothetical protein
MNYQIKIYDQDTKDYRGPYTAIGISSGTNSYGTRTVPMFVYITGTRVSYVECASCKIVTPLDAALE